MWSGVRTSGKRPTTSSLGKTFDNGVLCSSPNSVVVDEAVAEELRRECQALGAYFMNQAEMEALAKGLVTAQRLPNPAFVGKRRLSSLERSVSRFRTGRER